MYIKPLRLIHKAMAVTIGIVEQKKPASVKNEEAKQAESVKAEKPKTKKQ